TSCSIQIIKFGFLAKLLLWHKGLQVIDWTMSLCKLESSEYVKNHPLRERFALSLTFFVKFKAVNVNICRKKVGFFQKMFKALTFWTYNEVVSQI
ncbi:MAG: hypothetical protein IKF69_10150, partial [Exiguobacterium sp.]|nr:hypothetical protein [Exiguobacterium sp.]